MASHIKKGESLLIPFRNGQSISDSQLKPRMYKTMQAFEKAFPKHYLGTDGVELVEYAEVVRCKDCKYGIWNEDEAMWECVYSAEFNDETVIWFGFIDYKDGNDFCSYGERKDHD